MSDGLFSVAILAGGLATRMYPLTKTIPKSLLDVNGQPFIAHQLRLLRAAGASHVVLCVGYLGEQIEEVVGDGRDFGLKVEYSYDGPTLLHTAGALKRALPLLGDAFLILYGDSYLRCDYAAVQRHFTAGGKQGLMTVFRNEGRWDKSNVELSAGRILRYDKTQTTPEMKHLDYGLGLCRAAAFDSVPPGRPYDLARLYQDLLAQDELAAYEVGERFYEIGSAAGLAEIKELLRDR